MRGDRRLVVVGLYSRNGAQWGACAWPLDGAKLGWAGIRERWTGNGSLLPAVEASDGSAMDVCVFAPAAQRWRTPNRRRAGGNDAPAQLSTSAAPVGSRAATPKDGEGKSVSHRNGSRLVTTPKFKFRVAGVGKHPGHRRQQRSIGAVSAVGRCTDTNTDVGNCSFASGSRQ